MVSGVRLDGDRLAARNARDHLAVEQNGVGA